MRTSTLACHSLVALLVLSMGEDCPAAVAEAPHARVEYEGIDAKQADAIARTISAAREVYVRDFGADMPDAVVCTVTCAKGQPTRLFTDGHDRLFLSIPSKDKLAKPQRSGVFNLYGLCHELGHVAMYRALKDRDWLTGAAAEGWAHYAGSVVVDAVYKAEGAKLWYDPYDYREDGSARLAKQLAAKDPPPIVKAAGEWQKLEAHVGRKGFAETFTIWQTANIDPSNHDVLRDTLVAIRAGKKAELNKWWESARPLLVESRQISGVERKELLVTRLAGQPETLAGDDAAADGKRSIAGGGHARKFAAPGGGGNGGDWYLKSVSVHGSRYGPPKAPATEFDIILCDEQHKPIATWKKPYAAFRRGGGGQWVKFDVPPTQVPAKFAVAVVFRPTATSGVFVSFDAGTKGNSAVGIPGKEMNDFDAGDWMLRVEVDRPKDADALRGGGG